MEGEKESVFTIDAIQKNARFFCRVRDDFGNEKHCYFTIYVDNGLEILETSEAAPTVEFGQTTQLSVTAKAKTGELTYAWYKDGNIIEGANESVYTTEAIEKFTGYYCQVTDIYGNTQTAGFSVSVDNRLEIVSTSESEPIVAYGQTTELSVTAKANTGELTYEWYKDGNGIEGANGSVYKTEPIECYTTYQCHVTDVFGNTTSAWFYVFVDNGLEIVETSEPNPRVEYGQTTELSVTARANTGELTYEWYKEGTKIEGAEEPVYTTEAIECYTTYQCDVIDSFGNVQTVWFNVSVDTGLQILGDPYIEKEVEYGESVELSVKATVDIGEITYTWYDQDGMMIENASGNTCVISSVSKSGEANCLVSDQYGNTITVLFWLFVDTLEVDYDRMETYVNLAPGEEAVLTVYASTKTGNDLSYSWSYWDNETGDYIKLEGKEASLTTTAIYKSETIYYCTVSDGVDSSVIEFWIHLHNMSIQYDDAVYVVPGDRVTLSVDIDVKVGSASCRWDRYDSENGWWIENIGTDSSEFEFTFEKEEEYRCVIFDEYGNVEEAYFNVYELNGLVLEYDQYYELAPGDDITLSVSAVTKNPPVSYQWYYLQHNEDGDRYELIEGETSSTLSLINVQESGEYKCEAWDKNGDFAEADISIWVNSGLELEYDSSMIFAMPGEEVTVSVEAVSGVTSPDQITYQWYWENRQGEKTILTGETFNTLTFTAECTGSYYCEVNDSYMTKTAYFDVEIDSGLYVADTEIHREVKPGESITVQVDAIVSIGGLSYVWSKYNSETDSYEELEETGSSLTVIGGEVNDELTCQVQDDYGNTQTVFISLLVIGETAPDFESAVELNQGDKKPASIAEEEGRMYFKIVPESSGEYSFSSKGYFDTFARLYDENQNQLAENDDGGSENNFMITYNLEAGQTYYLEVSFYSENKTGSFYVVMEKEGECTHQWEYINVVPATCTTSGTRTPVCTQCGLTLESEVYQTALGHSAGSWKVSAATCTAAGEKVSSCTRCGAVVEKEAIGALGHSAGSWKVTRAATCTAVGEKVSSCTRCGAVVKKEAVPATGHKLGGWTVKSKATVFAKESQSRRCSACGYTENRTVGSKLKPTIKVSASTIVLKVKQSTTKLKVSGLAAGDSVKSWKSSNTKIVTVSSKGKLTAKGEIIREATSQVSSFMRIFKYDPTGMKKIIFDVLDPILKGTASFSYHRDVAGAKAFLNSEHEVWINPMEKTLRSKESFMDLFDRALTDCAGIMEKLEALFRKGTAEREDITSIVPDVASTHGLPCGNALEIRYTKEGSGKRRR